MSGNQAILREYLISLGFKTDQPSLKKFDVGIFRADLSVAGLLKTVLGATAAVAGMTTLFARSMERLYYSTRRAESSAGNLQALEFAAKQVGLEGGQMTQAIEGMARAIRSNPGLQGLIESFGIQVTGRDKSDVAIDLLDALRKMPFYVGQQYASMFGIGPDEFLLLSEGLDKIREAAALRRQMAQDAGVDADAAAKASKEYMNLLRRLGEKIGLIKDLVLVSLVEPSKQFVELLERGLDALTSWTRVNMPALSAIVGRANEKLAYGNIPGAWLSVAKDMAPWLWRWVAHGNSDIDPSSRRKASGVVGQLGGSGDLFSSLEARYGLPPGLLDRMWAKESGRGTNMLSPKGAQGHFQFMPETAKQYGVDPYDLTSSATGAAKMMADLLKWSGGDLQKALAGYNWGMGNVNKFGMSRLPAETQDYVQTLTGRPVVLQQQTTISVNGSDASEVARRVASFQDTVNGDAIRNLAGAVR